MIITFAYILVSILLTLSILLQNQGGGLGSAFGGSGSYHTRRGMEKALFSATIGLAVIFTGLSVIVLL